MKRNYYFIRHATPEENPKSVQAADMKMGMAGIADPPLSAMGRRQATEIAPIVNSLGVDYVLSSNMNRAVETASIIARETGIPLGERIEELREFAPGSLDTEKSTLIKSLTWNGWPSPIRQAIDSRMYRIMVFYYLLQWKRGKTTGGDSFEDMQDRIHHSLNVLGSHPGGDLAVVGHGYWLIFMAMAVMGNKPRNFFRLSYVENCSITRIMTNDSENYTLKSFAKKYI